MKSVRQNFITLFIFAAVFTAVPASAATVYISDELTVPLRSGPSGGHRIIHRGLPSGTQMEILDVNEEAGFTRIRTARHGGLDPQPVSGQRTHCQAETCRRPACP